MHLAQMKQTVPRKFTAATQASKELLKEQVGGVFPPNFILREADGLSHHTFIC